MSEQKTSVTEEELEERSWWNNRVVCDVLRELRQLYETRNFSSMLGLIEEAQSMVNRMEAGLQDRKDLIQMQEEKSVLKKEIAKLREEVKALKEERKSLRDPEKQI